MALIFIQEQSNTTNCATSAVCTGATGGTNTEGYLASVGGTRGTTGVPPTGAQIRLNGEATGHTFFTFRLTVGTDVEWAAGTWTVRINISSSNMFMTLQEIWICHTDGTCTSSESLGSSTGLGQSLGSTGVLSFNITGSAGTNVSPGDEVLISFVGDNSSMSTQQVEIQPDQDIDSPFNSKPFDPHLTAYRLYDDDAGEAASTALVAQDTAADIQADASDVAFQLRLMVEEQNLIEDGATTDDWQLQYTKGVYAIDQMGSPANTVNFSAETTGNIVGFSFSDSGRYLYVQDINEDIYQYECSPSYDITTATYLNITDDISAESTAQAGHYMNDAGTRMIIGNNGSAKLTQYNLSTPHDISTAAYQSAKDFNPTEITTIARSFVDKSGTRIYIGTADGSDNFIYQYSMSTPWDLGTASYDSKSYDISADLTGTLVAHTISDDGVYLIVTNGNGQDLFRYKMSTPWDISTASYDSVSKLNTGVTITSLMFVDNGTRLIIDDAETLEDYHVGGTAWTNITTTSSNVKGTTSGLTNDAATTNRLSEGINDPDTNFILSDFASASDSLNVDSQSGTSGQDVEVSTDGTKLFVLGNDNIYRYSLSPELDISAASYDGDSARLTGLQNLTRAMFFRKDGLKLYTLHDTSSDGEVKEWTLTTAWDLTTASHETANDMSVDTQDTEPTGLWFSSDGLNCFVVGRTNTEIFKYTLTVPWDLSTGSYASQSFDTATADAQDVAFTSDGRKMIVYYAGATEELIEYELSTPWDLSTAAEGTTEDVAAITGIGGQGMAFLPSTKGLQILLYDWTSTDTVYRLELDNFLAGEQSSDGLVDNHQLTKAKFTEHAFGLTALSADLADGDVVVFRLSTPTAIVNDIYPQINITAAAGDPVLAANSGSYAWTGSAATFKLSMSALSGSYAWTGTAATFKLSMSALSGSYDWTGTAATLSITAYAIAADSDSYAVTGSNVSLNLSMSALSTSYAWTGSDTTFKLSMSALSDSYAITGTVGVFHLSMSALSGSYTWTGTAATLNKGVTMAADTIAYDWTGTAANLIRGYQIESDSGGYTWIGSIATFDLSMSALSTSYAWTGTAATFDLSMSALSGSYSVTGSNVSLSVSISALSGSYAWTGTAATFDLSMSALSGSYAWTGTAADLSTSSSPVITAEAGSYLWTGSVATFDLSMSALSGSYSWTGTAATLNKGITIAADTVAYDWTGTAATFDLSMSVLSGSYSWTGTTANLLYNKAIDATVDLFTITGTAATLTADREITAETDSYSVTGSNVSLSLSMSTLSGSYIWTGTAATLSKTAYAITADSGSYLWTGTAASLNEDEVITALPASYTITGSAATFDLSMSALSGSYSWTGTATTLSVTILFDAVSGNYSITGTDASLEYGRVVNAESGSYLWTGSSADLQTTLGVNADPGSYLWTGTVASLNKGQTVSVDSGAYVVTGTAFTGLYNKAIDVGSAPYVVTGSTITNQIITPELYDISAVVGAGDDTIIVPIELSTIIVPADTDLDPNVPVP